MVVPSLNATDLRGLRSWFAGSCEGGVRDEILGGVWEMQGTLTTSAMIAVCGDDSITKWNSGKIEVRV